MYLLSRTRTAVMRKVLPMLSFPKPFSFSGAGSALSLCREIAGTGIKRLMLVTDSALHQLGLAKPMIAELERLGVTVEVFAEIEPDPGFELVLSGVARLKACQAQAVLAVGGGSSIDGAKALLACHANDCHPEKLVGLWLGKKRNKGLPFYAVPTTAGTGSEVTIGAVVTNKQEQVKLVIVDPKLVPSMIALDPTLMLGLPPFITAPTGMDALTHAVEAYLAKLATDDSDELALAATASVMRNLPLAYNNGQDIEARERMAVAACKAGLALTLAGLGYVHAFAHQLGGLYHVPHGLANAMLMPHVLDFSKTVCTTRLANLARASGIQSADSSDATLADAFIERIRQMNRDMQIPEKVKELRREDFEKIIDRAFTEAHQTYAVPRYMRREDALTLLEKLLA